MRNSILQRVLYEHTGDRLAIFDRGNGSGNLSSVQLLWVLRDRYAIAQIKGHVGCSLISVSYVNYVCFRFFWFFFGSESSSVLHQRIYSYTSHHHQFHPSPTASCRLILNGNLPRRVLCPPTRDNAHSGPGFCSLWRVLCLPTRGNDICQGSAPSRFGLFLWIAREVMNDVARLCTIDFNHSFRRVNFISFNKQLLSVPTRINRDLTVVMCFQLSVSASLHRFSKQFLNHTSGFCVTKVIPQQHVCCVSKLDNQTFSFAGMFRAFEHVCHLVVSNRLVLDKYERIACPNRIRYSFY